ncbi:uncharacterized protein BROUX77_001873 [Berkeleyomyces rouxiae]|uniref:uncharacterized protein n=1 Tax=Berkeleyomyces rouxiae TaxID=2035830 RepID=UPI003B796309
MADQACHGRLSGPEGPVRPPAAPSEGTSFGPLSSSTTTLPTGSGVNVSASASVGAGANDSLYSPVAQDLHVSPSFPTAGSSDARVQVQTQTQPPLDHAQVQAQAQHHLSSHSQHQHQLQNQQQQSPQIVDATQGSDQPQNQDSASILGHTHRQTQYQPKPLFIHENNISTSALQSPSIDSPLGTSSQAPSQAQSQSQSHPQHQLQPQAHPYYFNNLNLNLSDWPQAAGTPAFNASASVGGPLPTTASTNPTNAPTYPSAWDLSVLSPQEQNLHLQQLRLQQLQALFPHQSSLASAAFQQSPSSSSLDAISPEAAGKLTPAQLDRLKSIKMPPPHLRYYSPSGVNTPAPFEATEDSHGNTPMDIDGPRSSTTKKRKVSAEDDDDEEDDEDGGPVKKTAHNMIEKRYRTNLNDKIAYLRDSVPSLRIMSKSARGEDTTEDREELHGLTPAHKLNKATVLSKATEYIRHLEKRNNRLIDENLAMQRRIQAFEKLFMAGAMSGTLGPLPPNLMSMQYAAAAAAQTPGPSQYMSPQVDVDSSQPPETPAIGMIPVPDEMKRLLEPQMQGQPYPVPQQQFTSPVGSRQQTIHQQQQQMQQARYQNGGNNYGKLMVGSLAGLMILEAFREDEQSTEQPEGRGLSGFPAYLINSVVSRMHFNVLGHNISPPHILLTVKLLVMIGIVLCFFGPLVLTRKQKRPTEISESTMSTSSPIASMAETRGLPSEYNSGKIWFPCWSNPIAGVLALSIKVAELVVFFVFGLHSYQCFFRRNDDEEAERIHAWSKIIDTQLSGNDKSVGFQRLLFTFLSSMTFPTTPGHLMRKALHVQILAQAAGSVNFFRFDSAALCLSRSYWNEARHLCRALNRLKGMYSDARDDFNNDIAQHLALLLEQEHDDVLTRHVILKATQTVWNPTESFNSQLLSCAPLDAVAIWWSESLIHRALIHTLATRNANIASAQATIGADLDLAISTSPARAYTRARAAIAHALLVKGSCNRYISSATQILHQSDFGAFAFSDLHFSLKCALSMPMLHQNCAMDEAISSQLRSISRCVPNFPSLLSCVAALQVMETLLRRNTTAALHRATILSIARSIEAWIQSGWGKSNGMDEQLCLDVMSRCQEITKTPTGENDEACRENTAVV